jgi:hypothetical protein
MQGRTATNEHTRYRRERQEREVIRIALTHVLSPRHYLVAWVCSIFGGFMFLGVLGLLVWGIMAMGPRDMGKVVI